MRTFDDEISYADDSTTAPAVPKQTVSMRLLGMCPDSEIGNTIAKPEDAASIMLPMMHTERETLVVMLLDASRRVITAYVAAIGNADRVECDMAVIFRPAIVLNATYLLIAHNHPNNDTTPSQADVQTTRMIDSGCQILGLALVDHLVLTHNEQFRSVIDFMEKGF